jgi:hypothetical protein
MNKTTYEERMELFGQRFLENGNNYWSINDDDQARYHYSAAWGVYRMIEDVEKMTLCTRQLRRLRLSKQEIINAQNWGYNWIRIFIATNEIAESR